MCRFVINPHRREEPGWPQPEFGFLDSGDALEFHRRLPGYEPTPLVELPALAAALGVGRLWVKDESRRFAVKAFKPLGASYAMFRFLAQRWRERFGGEFGSADFAAAGTRDRLGAFTFCAATDGNHGRAVAWTARQLKQRAVIYMPANSAPARVQNIRGEGAEVVLVGGSFDDCVRRCAADAAANGWQAVADTAYEGYWEIPGWILLGYTTIFREIEAALHPLPQPLLDLVLLPAGVGGLAAAGAFYYARRYGRKRPRLACVEPVDADCFLESAARADGRPQPARGRLESIMAGLNCGVPSPLAWPIVRDTYDLFLAVSDRFAEEAMRRYYHPLPGDPRIVSGESGAATLAGLLALGREPALADAARAAGLGPQARVLLVSTEGDTDPENFTRVTGRGPLPA